MGQTTKTDEFTAPFDVLPCFMRRVHQDAAQHWKLAAAAGNGIAATQRFGEDSDGTD
jgi:hypothetical protein